MLKLEFTKQEVDEIKNKIYLSEIQERIFEYRLKEYSITKMAHAWLDDVDGKENKTWWYFVK